MKKIILIIFSLLFTSVSFANSYDEILIEAEKYENNKEWIYALGAYHDAMKISEDSNIAKHKYDTLIECIKEGNPGFGEFNLFSIHDEWVNLIKNAEKFFTETFPYKITYESLEMYSADYENKTANYKLSLIVNQSDFYKDVLKALQDGYEKTNHADWKDLDKNLWFLSDSFTMLLHSSWDGSLSSTVDFYRKSVYSTKQEKINKFTEYPILQNEANSIYQKERVAISYLAAPIIPVYKNLSHISGISVCEIPAFAACFSETMTTYNGHDYSVPLGFPYFAPGNQTCYDIKLGLFDKNDSLLLEGTRQTICTGDFSYCFSNITQEKLSILDTKNYTIKLLGIWLNYGVYDISLITDEDIENGTIRGIVKPLPDIQIKTDKVDFIDKKERDEQARLEKERLAKIEEDRLNAEKQELKDFISRMEEQYSIYEQKCIQAKFYTQRFFVESGTGIKFKLETGFNGNYWDYRRQWGIFSVDDIEKKSIALKKGIKEYDKLIMINGINISDLETKSNEIANEYNKLGSLIYNTQSLKSYSNKELEILKQKYDKLKLDIPDTIYILDGCYIYPLKSGTILTFQDRTNDSKMKEIIVP